MVKKSVFDHLIFQEIFHPQNINSEVSIVNL